MRQFAHRWHKYPVHQRPAIVNQPCPQPSHQCAKANLQKYQCDHGRTEPAQSSARMLAAKSEAGCEPYQRGKCQRRQQQMHRQTVLGHLHPVGQPRFHHPPADKALKAAQNQQAQQLWPKPCRQLAAQREPQQRQRKCNSDQPPQQPVAPFPEIDELETLQRHVRGKLGKLRNLLIFFKLRQPLGPMHRRKDAGHGFSIR